MARKKTQLTAADIAEMYSHISLPGFTISAAPVNNSYLCYKGVLMLAVQVHINNLMMTQYYRAHLTRWGLLPYIRKHVHEMVSTYTYMNMAYQQKDVFSYKYRRDNKKVNVPHLVNSRKPLP